MEFKYEKFIRKDNMVGRKKMFITLRPSGVFAFNSKFSKEAELGIKYGLVTIYTDPKSRVVGFRFHNDKEDKDALSLYGEGGGGRNVTASALFKRYKWIRAATQQDRNNRRFEPEWDKEKKLWFIRLAPFFEEKVERKSVLNVPSEAIGLYRYTNKGEVVYIGQGKIRSRAQLLEREVWNFDTIEYSIVLKKDDRKKWEAFWLERFQAENGELPFYNKISGEGG